MVVPHHTTPWDLKTVTLYLVNVIHYESSSIMQRSFQKLNTSDLNIQSEPEHTAGQLKGFFC